MSSTFGKNIKVSLFGESHGEGIGMVIDSLPAGIKIDMDLINEELSKRRPNGITSTARIESDEVEFLSGVYNGYTEGSPVAFVIRNQNKRSTDYVEGNARPSHSDLVAAIKYDGFNDYRGGGHFSGRITAPIVVLGAIAKSVLLKRGIKVTSHCLNIGEVYDDSFEYERISSQIESIEKNGCPVINIDSFERMNDRIIKAKNDLDSIGGSVEVAITGLPVGLGEPYFDSFESIISHLVFSIGGVKGISFGDGYAFREALGSEVNDQMTIEDGKVKYLSNHSGGILGGITNSEPVVFNVVIKPTPSISRSQKSINYKSMEPIDLEIRGRHDPCIVLRAMRVIEALTYYAVLEMTIENNKKRNLL